LPNNNRRLKNKKLRLLKLLRRLLKLKSQKQSQQKNLLLLPLLLLPLQLQRRSTEFITENSRVIPQRLPEKISSELMPHGTMTTLDIPESHPLFQRPMAST